MTHDTIKIWIEIIIICSLLNNTYFEKFTSLTRTYEDTLSGIWFTYVGEVNKYNTKGHNLNALWKTFASLAFYRFLSSFDYLGKILVCLALYLHTLLCVLSDVDAVRNQNTFCAKLLLLWGVGRREEPGREWRTRFETWLCFRYLCDLRVTFKQVIEPRFPYISQGLGGQNETMHAKHLTRTSVHISFER